MDYSFVRKLVKNIGVTEIKRIYSVLSEKGIELFLKIENRYENMTEATLEQETDLYVSAADLEYARELVQELGLGVYLCDEAETNANVQKSEVEKAEEEFYRKHRQNQIFAWGIIILVIIFIVIQFMNV